MTSRRSKRVPEPWRVHFFQRGHAEDPSRKVPAIDFLESVPSRVAAEIHAVLDAVAAAPPPSFSGGGKWEAMDGDMAGYFEIRVQGGGMNAHPRDYQRVKDYGAEFRKRRTVLP